MINSSGKYRDTFSLPLIEHQPRRRAAVSIAGRKSSNSETAPLEQGIAL
jgi:hypothetical protein